MPNKSIITDVVDDFTAHDVDLMRFEASVRKKTLRHLKSLSKDLEADLVRIAPGDPIRETAKFKRQKAVFEQSKRTIRSAYKGARDTLKGELRDLVDFEEEVAKDLVNSSIGADIVTVGLPPNAVQGIVANSLVEGATIGEWMQRQSGALQKRFEDQVRQGMLAGETNAEIIRRVRGRRVPGTRGVFEGGVMQTTTRDAEALVRTSVQQVANKTREDVYKGNTDVIKGMQALVTLDLRTSQICQARSASAWDISTGKPMPRTNTKENYPGPPPWHWRCRSTLIPILRSWNEISNKRKPGIKEIPPSTQSSMDGQVSAKINYEDWLKRQSASRQIKALGRTKRRLWKEGKITSFRELIDQTGRPLTIGELQEGTGGFQLANIVVPDSAEMVVGTFFKVKGFDTLASAEAWISKNIKIGDTKESNKSLKTFILRTALKNSPSGAASSALKVQLKFQGEAADLGKGVSFGIKKARSYVVKSIEELRKGFIVNIDLLPGKISSLPSISKSVVTKK